MIDNLLNHNSLRKYPQFDTLLTVLQDWNKRVDNNTIDSNVHAELTRNQFIYTSLMNITKVDSHCVKETLALLYNWYYKNSPK